MAPMTRKSQANPGVSKKVHRKRGAQAPAAKRQASDSWELLDTQGTTRDPTEGQDFDQDDQDDLTQRRRLDVQGAFGPLREMADRVGQEVESFAQLLDQMLAHLPSRASESQRFEWANEVIQEFQTAIEATVMELKKSLGPDKLRQSRKEWSDKAGMSDTTNALEQTKSLQTSVLGEKKAQQVKEIRDLQQEADLWDLLHIMLELRPFEAEAKQEQTERRLKLHKMGPAHRYTSEDELWERFELSNEVAVERKKVVKWLERVAQESSSEVYDIVTELEKKAGRGKGLWTSGWMHTREKIKGEKRLRNWPSDIDSLPAELRRAEDSDLLAVRLDPDAPVRQGRVLEKPDVYFERAVWIACWEMLRRGTPWSDICQWCEERKEGWRAACLGLASDTAESGSSRAAWRHLCRLAAQSGCSSEHEAAVFGLLGGNEDALKKICHSVDDRIYAFYNAKLLRAFDSFVYATCPDKVTFAQSGRQLHANALETPTQAAEANEGLLARLRKESATRDEMLQPMKVIQSYLLSDEIGTLLNTVGIMLGETARAQEAEGVIFFRSKKDVNKEEQIGERDIGLDPQTLRMAAHMSIIWRVLRNDPFDGDEQMEDDNILVAYIQYLRMVGKRDLIPIYASKLEQSRYVTVLGRVLQDITESEEQTRMLKLLQDYNFNVVEILTENLNLAFDACFGRTEPREPILRMLESTTETKLYPGQRIVAGFLSDEVTDADEAVVTALQWFQLLHGHWDHTFKALTEALTRALLHDNLPCARLITASFPYPTLSFTKTHQILHRALDLSLPTTHLPAPASTHEALARQLLTRQARTYADLSLLVCALESLAHWRDEEAQYLAHAAAKPSTVPASLKAAKARVTEAMEPVMRGLLLESRDAKEAGDLAVLRERYVPELVLAYNVVLHAAGNLISREALLESMELGVAVAADDGEGGVGNGLARAFQAAGRMRELLASLALTSKVMLVLKAEGKPWRARREREGKELGVWEVGRGRGAAQG